ncbi:tail fiber protein, partial (plasmid) [Chromobacterium amazonense]
QATQQEVLSVLKDTGQNSDPARQDQLLQAVKKIAWGGNSKPTTLAGYGITDGLTLRPQLGDRVDLNNITDDGLYHNPADAYAANGINYPTAQAGLLFVYSDGQMVYQQYQSYANAGIWYRCRYGGNWPSWRKLSDAATTLAGYGITDGATKAELKAAVDGLVSGAPGALNTLQELAAALGNDNNFAATITNKLAGKADKSSSLAGYGINTLALSTAQTSQIFKTTPNVYDNNLYTNGTLELRSTGTDFPSLGLHRPGNSAVALVHKSYGDDTLVLKEATGSEYRVWHSGNDSQIIKKRRYRVHADDGTSLDTSISAGEMGFNYGTSSGVNGPFIAFGGLGGSIDYSCQLTADYGSGSIMRFRTRNDDSAGHWNPWRTLIHEGHLTGQVAFFAMSAPPQGWLKANGAAVSRKDYPSLFAALGTYYGAGDGSTTFNLPDLRGEFVRGWDDGRGVDNGRGFGTRQNPTAIRCLIDKYSGGYSAGTFAIGAWNTENDWTNTVIEGNKTATDLNNSTFYITNASAAAGSGDNGAFSTRPRNIALLACIKY